MFNLLISCPIEIGENFERRREEALKRGRRRERAESGERGWMREGRGVEANLGGKSGGENEKKNSKHPLPSM